MAYVYKLIFDISVYYGISGYYMILYMDAAPSLAGMLLLVAAIVSYRLVSEKYPDSRWKNLLLLLPGIALLFSSGLVPAFHLLPAWCYGAYCVITEKKQLTYPAFRKSFGRRLILLAVFIPPLINEPMAEAALSNSAIYVILWLFAGVSCSRCLREKQENLRQMLVPLGAIALCGILTYFGVPQFLVKCLNDYVIQVLINGLLIIGLLFASLIFALFDWLMSINGPPKHSNGIALETDSIAQIMGIDPSEMKTADADFFWLNMIGYIVGALAILVVLIILIRKLVKSAKNRLHKDNQKSWSVERQLLHNNKKERKLSRRKLQNPRETVRYYYARYMRECNKRGVKVQKHWTSEELAVASKPYFAEDDILQMEGAYRQARYNPNADITAQDAKLASKLWQNFKKTK